MRAAMTAAGLAVVLAGSAAAQPPPTPGTKKIQLIERAGIERVQFPVELSVRFPIGAVDDPRAIRLARMDGGRRAAVPVQVLDFIPQEVTSSFSNTPQTFVRLAVLADVPAGGTVEYELSTSGPAVAARAPLKTSGQGIQKRIDAGPVLFEIDEASGQLLALTPKQAKGDRLTFVQEKQRGPKPIHWNPDVWAPPTEWTHTHRWNRPTPFDAEKHQAHAPPKGADKEHPYFYRHWQGPLAYRVTRWGRMPLLDAVDASVSYTFYAGTPMMSIQSLVEFREGMQVHAVRNAELVFSRHQLDTAAWIDRSGKLHTAPCYDYNDPDRSFGFIAERLPADTPVVALANEKKGFGIALVTLNVTHLNKYTGQAADEQAHIAIRDYDEHGRGNPYNFTYFVRYVVFRDGYRPTYVDAGSVYAEETRLVVFRIGQGEGKYDDLIRWHKLLTHPLEVVVD